jgi:cytochrome o ubiquinol oxidase subunit 2
LSRFLNLALLPLAGMLSACNTVVLAPAGDIARQQRDLLIESTVLMLLIIIPVMALTVLFAWRYRHSNTAGRYEPDWNHSTQLELVIWSAPLLIIICLGAVTWASTHLLDPYRPLDRIATGQSVTREAGPLRVNVVALDWKWLFIYPDYGIAIVNELAAPVNRPIEFRITASSVMNSFYIPALAGQVYAMPGMQTQLNAVINKAGVYRGFSANYSGAGFSGMRFAFHGLEDADFANWVAAVKAEGGALDRATYLMLERPSENEPVRRYASADSSLFNAIINMCVEPSKMCMSEMSAIDAKGGLGLAGVNSILPLEYDKSARRGAIFGDEPSYVAGLCAITEAAELNVNSPPVSSHGTSRLIGAGLPRPPSRPFRLSPAPSLTATRWPSNS